MQLPKSVFTFSFDTELIWGMFRYNPAFQNKLDKDWFKKRRNIQLMLREFNRYDIPATWAIVGHLFLDKCNKKHADIKKGDDWIKQDPGTNLKKAPLWYGKDIIDLILSSKAKHEIASHSFSHIDFDTCSPAVADSELKKCRSLFNKLPCKLTTFIFPRDKYGNFEALRKNNIKIYRKEVKTKRDLLKSRFFKKIVRALDIFCFFKADPLEPIVQNNKLIQMPKSRLIVPINKETTGISSKTLLNIIKYFNLLKIKRTINKAIAKKIPIHLYSHPIDFTSPADLVYLRKILAFVKKKEMQKKLECLTMQQTYEKYLK